MTQYCKLLVLGITSKHLNHSPFFNIWMLKYFTSVCGCWPRFSKATISSTCLHFWMPPCTANFCNGAPFSEVLAYPAYADGVRKTKLLIFFENLIFNLAIPLWEEEWSGVGGYVQGHARRLGQARHELNFAQNHLNCKTILLVLAPAEKKYLLWRKRLLFSWPKELLRRNKCTLGN